MVGASIALITSTAGAVTWLYDLQATVRSSVESLPQIQHDLSTALRVLGDHGGEINQVRSMHTELLTITNELKRELGDRTQLRYTSRDAEKDWAIHEKEHRLEHR